MAGTRVMAAGMKERRGVCWSFVFDEGERLTDTCHRHSLSPSQAQAEDTQGKGCSACPHRERRFVKLILVHSRIRNVQNSLHSTRYIQAMIIRRAVTRIAATTALLPADGSLY